VLEDELGETCDLRSVTFDEMFSMEDLVIMEEVMPGFLVD
jgi:hypothetical protein